MSEEMKSKTPSRSHGPMGGGPGGHGPGGPGMVPGEKAKDFKGTLRKLMKYLGKYKIAIVFVIIFVCASTIFAIVGPKILGQATTEIFNGLMSMVSGSGEGIDFSAIGKILLFLLGLYVLSALFNFIQSFIMTDVSTKISYRMRKEIEEKIHRLPLSFYDRTSNGEVLSRLTNDVDAISMNMSQSVTQVVSSIAMIVGILIMMFSISWQMTLAALLIVPVSLVFVTLIVKRSQKHFVNQQKYLGKVNGHVEEMFSSHVVVKAFNGEEAAEEQFNGYNEKLYESAWKSQFLSGLMGPITMFIGNLGYVVVCILGGTLAVSGGITVGDIQAFVQYVRQFTQPINQVAQVSNILQAVMAAAERVFEFLDETEEPEKEPIVHVNNSDSVPDTDSLVHISGSVQFAHVKFGYIPEKTIITDFSANIKPGQKVAIVGPTGAGKTTMVKLLMRFYDVTDGAILLDGYDIRDFSRFELRENFGMVLQDAWLYSGSIADNIRYGKLDASDEDVRRAAKAAQVDHFVRTLPDGYNMVLNEEASNVSQGQKQLLTIARAILADPKVLILDEATSSVDTRTELLIQKAMDNLMKGRTSFVIAHRLSTIRDADLILVMRDGDIVEQGNHEELMAKGEFYANLYNSQFERAEVE